MENLKQPEEGKKEQVGFEEESEEIKFNPTRRPGIPRGARFRKGETVFHKRAKLWDAAKSEYDQGVDHGAVEKYKNFEKWMNGQYGILADSFEVAKEAVKKAGLTVGTKEEKELFDKTRLEYIKKYATEWQG